MRIELANRKALVDIQHHLGTIEYACRYCGCVNSWDSTEIKLVQFKNSKKKHYKPMCHDCGLSGAWLLQSKAEKIWWKGSSTDLEEFDSKLLSWMLRVGYFGIKSPRMKAAVERTLETRLFKPEVIADIQLDREEQKNLEGVQEQYAVINDYEKDLKDFRQKLVSDSPTMDYFEVRTLSKKAKTTERRIESARKVLAKLLDEQDERNKPTA